MQLETIYTITVSGQAVIICITMHSFQGYASIFVIQSTAFYIELYCYSLLVVVRSDSSQATRV